MKHDKLTIWRNLPLNKRFWVFYYYCKNKGDIVSHKKNNDGTVNLYVQRKLDENKISGIDE